MAPPWTRVHYFWHKQGNSLVTLMFNLFFNTTFTDTYTCYLLYRRSLLDPAELESDGWEQHAEILCRLVPRAKSCYEVAVSYAGRTYAEGKKIRAKHALAVLGMIARRRLALFVEGAGAPPPSHVQAVPAVDGRSVPVAARRSANAVESTN